jgi:SAM-dependent methyltransferase
MAYDEVADFRQHVTDICAMDGRLAACGAAIDWERAVVLDLGGGGAMHSGLLAGRARRVYCADVADQHLRWKGEFLRLLGEKFARHGERLSLERMEVNTTDAHALLYRDALFDVVVSFNAFEHIPDPAQALREVARVLKAGGWFYASFDPVWTADTGSHFAHRVPDPWAHLEFTEEQFIAAMRATGAADDEVADFRFGMNRWRPEQFRDLVERQAPGLGFAVRHFDVWCGTVDPNASRHPAFARLTPRYSTDELLTRGMAFVLSR